MLVKVLSVDQDKVRIGYFDGRMETVALGCFAEMPRVGNEYERYVDDNGHMFFAPASRNTNTVYNVFTPRYGRDKICVNKYIYVLLAIFLGSIGAHKFYAGKTWMGIIYLLFAATGISGVLGLIEGIMALTKPADYEGNIYL